MENSNNIFVTMAITLLSFMFAVISIVPIIGPGLGAYAFGASMCRNRAHGFSNAHALISIAIGEFIYFLFISLMLSTIISFYESGIFWYLIISGFILNYLFSVALYFWGDYKTRKKRTAAV